jgi:type V secretory pathway adhesin AidA
MKYCKTYEAFKKGYQQKIDLDDFKAIKKGTKLLYMGSEAEVLDNDGFTLTLKQNGKKFTVNKSMFDRGGMLKETINEGADNLVSDPELEEAWYQVYNERFKNAHPGIFKIMLKRPPMDKRELNRIWEETFNKSFEDEHPNVWAILFGKG